MCHIGSRQPQTCLSGLQKSEAYNVIMLYSPVRHEPLVTYRTTSESVEHTRGMVKPLPFTEPALTVTYPSVLCEGSSTTFDTTCGETHK
jgi:hypothetical protein